MNSLLTITLCAAALQATVATAGELEASTTGAAQKITRAGSQPSATGPSDFFTGRARIDPVWPADRNINASGGLVTFEPGARSAWHTHPAGQHLLVVSGVGLTQEWGKVVQEIRTGDVVWCPPGVKHWMTHLAVSGTV